MPSSGLKIGTEPIKRVEGARFLGVWVDEGIKWKGQIEKVRAKVGRLLGVIGRAGTVVGRESLVALYNSLVLPHLQYCLMAWGDFRESRNMKLGDSLLTLQKRIAGVIVGKRGRYHSDPILAEMGILKIGDLYRQQLRIHAWKFWNGKLPVSQAGMLTKVNERHEHDTRLAGRGISCQTQDLRSIKYRVPKEWESLTKAHREVKGLSGFKSLSKKGFIADYAAFKCTTRNCYVCNAV